MELVAGAPSASKILAGQGCPAYGLYILFPPNPFHQWRSGVLRYIFKFFFRSVRVYPGRFSSGIKPAATEQLSGRTRSPDLVPIFLGQETQNYPFVLSQVAGTAKGTTCDTLGWWKFPERVLTTIPPPTKRTKGAGTEACPYILIEVIR